MLNVEFTALLLQRETCGICSYDVGVTVHVMTLEPWTMESLTVPYTLGNNDWEFEKEVHITMHFYSWIWVCLKCRRENTLQYYALV